MEYTLEQLTEVVIKQNELLKSMGDSLIHLEYCILGLADLGKNPEVTKIINDHFTKRYKILHIVQE